jgi:hypothetical protein
LSASKMYGHTSEFAIILDENEKCCKENSREMRRGYVGNASHFCTAVLDSNLELGQQSSHRVAIANFWRTTHHDGKSALTGEGGGCTPTPFQPISITYKVVVYTLLLRGRYLFYLYPL